MAEIIEQKKQIQVAINKFRKLIRDKAIESKELEWAFPNGEKAKLKTYSLSTSYGILGVGIPKNKWNTRVPHLFTLSMDASVISPDVEINIPLNLDRKVSGVYVKNDKDIWLCSRGDFTAYRGKIKRDITFSYFNKWLLDVEDGEKIASIIPIAALSSPNIENQIASFVFSVNELKSRYKNIEDKSPTSISNIWNNGNEFEGLKTRSNSGTDTEYEYLHGPICNDLQRYLQKITSKIKYSVAKNKNIDMAIIKNNKANAIFEVKTSYSLSGQLYKGIGQLETYKHFYGDSKTKLFLVVPYEKIVQKNKLISLMTDLNIYIVEHKGSDFFMSNEVKLNEFLRNQKIV